MRRRPAASARTVFVFLAAFGIVPVPTLLVVALLAPVPAFANIAQAHQRQDARVLLAFVRPPLAIPAGTPDTYRPETSQPEPSPSATPPIPPGRASVGAANADAPSSPDARAREGARPADGMAPAGAPDAISAAAGDPGSLASGAPPPPAAPEEHERGKKKKKHKAADGQTGDGQTADSADGTPDGDPGHAMAAAGAAETAGSAESDDVATSERNKEAPPSGKDKAKLKIGGYLQIQGSSFRDTSGDGITQNSTLFVRRARFGARGRIIKGLSFELEIDAAEQNTILKDAYISFDFVPHHKLRLGQKKTPFGYENRTSSTRLYVIDRSDVTRELGKGPDMRDLGIFLRGDWKLPAGFGVEYDLAVVNGAGANVVVDDTPGKTFWGRTGASWTTPQKLVAIDIGVSYANGGTTDANVGDLMPVVYRVARTGADLEIETPYSFVAIEYIRATEHHPILDITGAGYYGLLVLKAPWRFGALGRYQVFDPDRDSPGRETRRWTVGAYYDLVPVRARLLVNYDIDRSLPRVDSGLNAWTQLIF